MQAEQQLMFSQSLHSHHIVIKKLLRRVVQTNRSKNLSRPEFEYVQLTYRGMKKQCGHMNQSFRQT